MKQIKCHQKTLKSDTSGSACQAPLSPKVTNKPKVIKKVCDTACGLQQIRQSENYLDAKKIIQNAIKNQQSSVEICHRYSLESLLAAIDLGITSLKLHHDMKAGKTYSIGWLLKHHPEIKKAAYISHLIAINESTTLRFKREFNLKFQSYRELQSNDNPQGIGTTLNSAPMVTEKLDTHTFDLVAIDETEGVAPFLANGTITNKAQVGKTLRKISQSSNILILSDAHMSTNTATFQQTFMPERQFFTITNTYQHWQDVTYNWIDNRNDGIEYVKQCLGTGNPLFVYFTSSKLADQVYKACNDLGLFEGLKTLLASGSTSNRKAVKAAKKDNRLFNGYDIVFASPTLGIGLSIEGDHFQNAITFFSRDTRTGNSQSALQMPFRTRNIKHLTCVKVDNIGDSSSTQIENSEINERAQALANLNDYLIRRAYDGDGTASTLMSRLANTHVFYEAAINTNNAIDSDQYFARINRELIKKGMKEINAPVIDQDDEITRAELKKARETIKEENKEAVITAPDKTTDEIIAIESTLSFRPDVVTDDELNALRKHRLKENYLSKETEEALNQIKDKKEKQAKEKPLLSEAWELMEKGIHTARKHIQSALLPVSTLNRICKTWITGIGQSQVMQKDIASTSAAHLSATTAVDRLILKYSGLKQDKQGQYHIKPDTVIDDAIVRDQNSSVRFVKEITALRRNYSAVTNTPLISQKKIKQTPAKVLVDLLRSRLGLVVKKVRQPKKVIVKRQIIKANRQFPEISQAIAKTLGANKKGRMQTTKPLEITNKLIADSGFTEAITENVQKHYNDHLPKDQKKITKRQIQSESFALFLRLAELLKIKIDRIAPDARWIIPTDQIVIENLNIAETKDLNNLRNLDSKISAELCLDDDNLINADTKTQLKITKDTEQHIKICLNCIETNQHRLILREYLQLASQTRDANSRFSALAKANLFLLDKAGLKNSRSG